jgi:putative membrane protein
LGENHSLAVHYSVRALLLAGFACCIVYLVRSGNLDLYIAERMQWLVKLSALALYAVAAQQSYSALVSWFGQGHSHPDCEDCIHEMPATWGRSLFLYGWFMLPLAFGFLVPVGMLGTSFADAKGVQFAPQQLFFPATPSDEIMESYAAFGKILIGQNPILVNDAHYLETLTTFGLFPAVFIGRTVEISGFVYRDESMDRHQFGVSRFAISCCSADAIPFAIMATSKQADRLATDDWVRVRGTVGMTSYRGKDIVQISVNEAVKLNVPSEPYVSSELNFGAK